MDVVDPHGQQVVAGERGQVAAPRVGDDVALLEPRQRQESLVGRHARAVADRRADLVGLGRPEQCEQAVTDRVSGRLRNIGGEELQQRRVAARLGPRPAPGLDQSGRAPRV